jgi:voltage-gated potassium channel
VPKNSSTFLFVGLLVLLGLEPFLAGLSNSGPLIQLAFTALLIFGVFSLVGDGLAFKLGVALAALALLAEIGYWLTDSLVLRISNLVFVAGFALLAITAKIQSVVFAPGRVTRDRVIGALCVYLLIGVVWAVAYTLVEIAVPAAFHYAGVEKGDPVEHLLYFSFVNLTTLGFGDITPIHPVTRTLSYLEAIIGQLYVAVLVASLVGRMVAGRGTGTHSDAG